jgi:glycine cleavage system H protein
MSEDHYPDDLLYHPEHDWARVEASLATFGITWYAQDALGEIVFWDAPAVGAELKKDDVYAELESVKAVTQVIAPLSGKVIEVNDRLTDEASLINESSYQDGWLVRVHLTDPAELSLLLSPDAYRAMTT